MNILIVDDEHLARSRLRTLLGNIPEVGRVTEAAAASQALDALQKGGATAFDVILLDIQMPGMNGVAFARFLRNMAAPPAFIFVTAHPEYATQAFDLEAADYLTKPVRLERLQQALKRAMLLRQTAAAGQSQKPLPLSQEKAALPDKDAPFLVVNERGRIERVLLEQILFCKAEQKYVTLHTQYKDHIYDGSLNELEAKYPELFLRVHRNALVARKVIRELQKVVTPEEGEQWLLSMHGTSERLAVSRRQLTLVKSIVSGRRPDL